MISQQMMSEDTRLVLKDEFAEAYATPHHPERGIATIVYDLIEALEWAESAYSAVLEKARPLDTCPGKGPWCETKRGTDAAGGSSDFCVSESIDCWNAWIAADVAKKQQSKDKK